MNETPQTDNQLDMAIDGRGYFIVNRPDGSQAYTRAGSFQVSGIGQLVALNGLRKQVRVRKRR